MAKRDFYPALFDLSQDIAGDIPLALLQAWIESPKTEQAATTLLESTKVTGVSVSSDSAGLSKLSREKSLIEVLAYISQPKEVVFGLGKAIGGEGIGVWAADNTQMFYPANVAADTIVNMLIETQKRIGTYLVKIGFGAHFGTFYRIGGGLYGTEADFIEKIAEENTEGGEIVVSDRLMEQLHHVALFQFMERKDLNNAFSKLFHVVNGPGNPDLEIHDYHYPIPYSNTFFEDIRQILPQPQRGQLALLEEKYIVRKVIVLIERERLEADSLEVEILNNLSFDTLMSKTAHELLELYHGDDIKTVSSLGIYVFDEASNALTFAEQFQQKLLHDDGVRCKIGMDVGSVIIFDLPNGRKDIAGSPVNIASKMAQDKGEFGHIYISDEIGHQTKPGGFVPFNLTVSGIVLYGMKK